MEGKGGEGGGGGRIEGRGRGGVGKRSCPREARVTFPEEIEMRARRIIQSLTVRGREKVTDRSRIRTRSLSIQSTGSVLTARPHHRLRAYV